MIFLGQKIVRVTPGHLASPRERVTEDATDELIGGAICGAARKSTHDAPIRAEQCGTESGPRHPGVHHALQRETRSEVPLLGRSPAVLTGVLRDITALSAPPPPAHRRGVPTRDGYPVRHLE